MRVLTMRGQHLDMARLMAQNAHKIALGNASMNARGDIIDGGRVIKPREQIARDYHRGNPKAVRQVALRDISQEVFVSPAEAWETAKGHGKVKKRVITDKD